MTRTIVVGNVKGGAGKTTTAVELALHLHRTGRTLLVDGDPRRSSLSWAARARANGTWPPGLETFALPYPTLGRRLRRGLGDGFEFVVVDTAHDPGDPEDDRRGHPGRQIGPQLAGAIEAADLVVVPTAGTLLDLDGLPDITGHLEAEAQARASFRWSLLITQFDYRRGENFRNAILAAFAARGWPCDPIPVPYRAAVADALGNGHPLVHYSAAAAHVLDVLDSSRHRARA